MNCIGSTNKNQNTRKCPQNHLTLPTSPIVKLRYVYDKVSGPVQKFAVGTDWFN